MGNIARVFDVQFARLHAASQALIRELPAEKLYWRPRESSRTFPVYSCGEHILRSAGTVERTFGGITTNLWDDPFEWTLPETLSTSALIADYLNEVEATRCRGFQLFRDDNDLMKEIAVPTGEMQTIIALLLDTIARAAHHQGCAFATFRLFSDKSVPRM